MEASLCLTAFVWVSHLSVSSCLVLGVAASAGNGFKCLPPTFKCIFTVIDGSDACHNIIFTSLHWIQPDQAVQNSSSSCSHITSTTRYIRLNTRVLCWWPQDSSEHVGGRMEKWLFCAMWMCNLCSRPRSKHKNIRLNTSDKHHRPAGSRTRTFTGVLGLKARLDPLKRRPCCHITVLYIQNPLLSLHITDL